MPAGNAMEKALCFTELAVLPLPAYKLREVLFLVACCLGIFCMPVSESWACVAKELQMVSPLDEPRSNDYGRIRASTSLRMLSDCDELCQVCMALRGPRDWSDQQIQNRTLVGYEQIEQGIAQRAVPKLARSLPSHRAAAIACKTAAKR